jgi:mono/diheme cytochrome c family protein
MREQLRLISAIGRRACGGGALLLLLNASSAPQAQPADAAGMAFYETKVLPLLKAHCLKCHGGGERLRGGLNLTYRTGLLTGGDQGAAVDLAAPDQSLLLAMLSYADDHHEMPPSGKLPDADIAVIAEWVRLGVPMPDDAPLAGGNEAPASPYNNQINDASRNWWSYRKVARPPVPAVADPAWAENPIDAFVEAQRAAKGLHPVGEADRATLMRRVHFDLTGLPPAPEAVAAFVADPDPQAYEKLVDQLLASPAFGEKWGRHWLDLVRYAETNGYERDNPKPHIWRYRDYVIDAFNQDKPYDRFVREQLAGDELPDGGRAGIIATGFYRLGIWDDEPVDKLQGRYDTLDGVVQTTTEVFLGTTMACARCHDHKIDPLPQADYYKLLSFFDNVTDMHTTDITRSILSGDDAVAFEAATRDHAAGVARRERMVKKAEAEFLNAYQASPEAKASVPAHPSDMSGLRYRFFRDTWEKLPDFDTLKHETEGAVPHGFFDIGLRTRDEAIGFVFEGQLHVPQDGEYVFYIDADDGARLTVDGAVVLDHDGANVLGNTREARVTLKAGDPAIRLDYFQHNRTLGLSVSWSGPGFERRALANEQPKLDLPALIAAQGDALVESGFAERYARLRRNVDEARNKEVPGGEYAACVTERGAAAPQTYVHFRGNPNVPGDAVQPGFPEVLGFEAPALPPPAKDAPTTGRRSVLADWIVRADNPLTARVMVNRLWQYHFGRGIVPTPNDFGQAGLPPSHPELLDWLAAEFVEGGWTMKRMHRMILLSKTYRLDSAQDTANLAKDSGNEYLWRFNPRRLTAEELRDTMLWVNGTINLKLGGPSVYPPMPKEILETSSTPDKVWQSSPPEEYTRRSVYIHAKRSLLTPLLTDYDLADTDNSCPVRFSTTQPTQALNLLNSAFVNEQAVTFARRLAQEQTDEAARIQRAFELATGQPPDAADVAQGQAFLQEMQQRHGLAPEKALERFALLVLNLNEFVFID